jgi:transposase
MFPNVHANGSMLHVASRAGAKGGAKPRPEPRPATRRRTADRLRLDGREDVVAELDRRSSRIANPNSRLNVLILRDSSNPQGREATMQHDPSSQPVAGIDVSKKTLDVFIDIRNERFTLDNSECVIADLIDRLCAAQVHRVVIEATGRYHRRVAATLLAAGINTSVVNPQRTREFAKAMGKLEKSDAIDAQVLAEFARRIAPQSDQIERKNQTILSDLVSRRRSLVQLRVAEKNRAHDDLPKLAASQSKKLLRLIEQQIEDLDREIAKLIEADDDWHNKSQIIDSVPGIGPDSANQLVVDLPELGKLNRQEIAKLAGVAPLNCDSGQFRGQRRIRGGRHDVRTTLYMLAHNAVLYCPRFKQFFERLQAKGKKHKVAMTACMRKLLTTLNQMVKTNTHWNQNLTVEIT